MSDVCLTLGIASWPQWQDKFYLFIFLCSTDVAISHCQGHTAICTSTRMDYISSNPREIDYYDSQLRTLM